MGQQRAPLFNGQVAEKSGSQGARNSICKAYELSGPPGFPSALPNPQVLTYHLAVEEGAAEAEPSIFQ